MVAASSVTAAGYLAYVRLEDGTASGFDKALEWLFVVLWLPAKLANRVFGFAVWPFHTAEDVVSNIAAYVQETFILWGAVAWIALTIRRCLMLRATRSP